MNQDLKTSTSVDNNNEQQPEEDSKENSKEESKEGFEEVSEESSEDSSEEDQELTVEESSKALKKKLTPPLPKLNLEPVQVPKALNLNPDPDFELEDNVEQVLITTFREVKITKLDLFYKDKKKLKVYLA
ncbi:hypothetical protein B7463_g840, partial [Scytalidium lignicola]